MLAALRVRWLALYAFAVCWFSTPGFRTLISPDEGRYAEIAREMLNSGDWITPRLNGIKYFEKPPLQYWMTAGSFRIFGENEFAARFWPALTGFAAVVMVWATLRRLLRHDPHGETQAWAGAAVLASCAWWVGSGHFLTLDMGVTAFLTLALCGFLWAQQDDASARENSNGMLVAWIAMALAMLSKGLIGPLIPGAALVIYSVVMRDWHLWQRLHLVKGLILFTAIAAPWFVLVSQRNPEFAQFFFVHEHLQRYATHEASRVQPWFFFIPVLVGGMLPWTALLPAAWREGLSNSTRLSNGTPAFNTSRFLLVWSAFVFVFFSISGSKLPAYILPMFPSVVMLMAPTLSRIGRRTGWALVITQALVGLIALIGAPILAAHSSDPQTVTSDAQYAWWLYATAAVALLSAAVAAWLLRRQLPTAMLATLALAGLVSGQLPLLGYDAYAGHTSSRAMVQVLRPHLRADSTLYSVRTWDQTLPFYLKQNVQLVEYVDEFKLGQTSEPDKQMALEQFEQHWRSDPAPLALVQPDTWQLLEKHNLPMQVVYRDRKRMVIARP
ncbi:glycosyltransferase family 39 protein [Silvimonas sp. JCM 19000]